MTAYPTLCRCDRVLDARGMCPHCDAAPTCPKPVCPDCHIRDTHCVVCKTPCGTRSAALNHESACRQAEVKKEKKK